jgi:hypothetical protein
MIQSWSLLVQLDFLIMIFAIMIDVAGSVYGGTENEFYCSTDDALCGVLMIGFGDRVGFYYLMFLVHLCWNGYLGCYTLHTVLVLGFLLLPYLVCEQLLFYGNTFQFLLPWVS